MEEDLDILFNMKKIGSSSTSSKSSVYKVGSSVKSKSESESGNEDLSDSESSVSATTVSTSVSSSGKRSSRGRKKFTQEEIVNMKKEILYQFDRMEKKGIKLPRKFTMASSLEEMKVEYDRLKKDREVDNSVKFQRGVLMTLVTGIEFMNSKLDPFDVNLDGWSEAVNDDIHNYDDIFEELHEKYKGRANFPPELKLMFALGGSAFMFHLKTTMFKNMFPDMHPAKGNPAPTSKPTSGAPPPPPSGGGLGAMLGSLFGGGGVFSGVGVTSQGATPPRGQMRGPSNAEDILRELNADRVETVETMTESEFSMDDGGSNVFIQKKTGGRTLQI